MFQNHVGIGDVSSAPHLTKEGLAFEFLWARLLPAAQGEAKKHCDDNVKHCPRIAGKKSCEVMLFPFLSIFCHIKYDRSSGDSHP